MKQEWCYFDKYFTKELCEKILTDSEDIPSRSGTIGTIDGFVINEQRKSEVKFVNRDNEKFSWLFDELWELAKIANDDYFNYDIDTLNYLQIAKYECGDKYDKHRDVIWFDTDKHRKLSCTVQLSDPKSYVGGELTFHTLQKTYPDRKQKQEIRDQGTVIFFPSLIEHSIYPILADTRYSLTAWFEGPKWR